MAQKRQISNGVNRTIRAVIGAALILVITFSAISICQNLGKGLKLDVTDQELYTLSDGTKAILAKLHQPITAKLYYAKTAALKAPDQIRYFNNYYEFVKTLLEQYVAAADGMVRLEVIDPRPFSSEEEEALRYGLKRFPITQEEAFFFGLVVQTQFGVEKAVPFFSPDRQNFVEYDISYLIDTVITRQKKKVGVMSSLPVMGEDVSSYMAQMMRMQGQEPTPPWTIVQQLRKKYEVQQISTDVNDVNDVNDIDILLVIYPKDLPEKTLFAIDQFVLKGGRTVVCVDAHCIQDKPSQGQMYSQSQGSNPDILLRNWGLEMPQNTFAGDRTLMLAAPVGADRRLENIIGFLELNAANKCFNPDTVMTANLNQVRLLFPGVLKTVDISADTQQEDDDKEQKEDKSTVQIDRTPLLSTSDRGNSFKVSSPYEVTMMPPSKLLDRFIDGTQPVNMGYLVTGRFKSAFPDGIEIEVEAKEGESEDKEESEKEPEKVTKHITGLKQATQDCAVVVFSDVDFITDNIAYRDSFFGKLIVGDNSSLLLNAIDDLTGSSDLISIRSRGNFKRPFTVVDEIERQAEAETAAEVAKINVQIGGFNKELQSIVSSAQQGQEEVVGSSIVQKKRELELKIHQAQRQLRDVKATRRERIEHLGNMLRQINMLAAPIVILVIAVVLGLRRSIRKRHYISHASDA